MSSTLRTQFLLKYRHMTKDERDEIVLTLDGEPYTWNPIYIEVYNFTKIGQEMLRQLKENGDQ